MLVMGYIDDDEAAFSFIRVPLSSVRHISGFKVNSIGNVFLLCFSRDEGDELRPCPGDEDVFFWFTCKKERTITASFVSPPSSTQCVKP